ncbi:MAG: hypothetical protein CVV27_20210 [Candidatus Melainabacteria bacterium HGW-Melainabacteria-1]|nr:MAG: hypothetical protein CVV27_20210 [Candidatus Melainabacteria bacterium HGW-Melainabacteria-1]
MSAPPKILISAVPFAESNPSPLSLLQAAGLEVCRHPFARKPQPEELLKLLQNISGLIAGTESVPGGVLLAQPQLRVISRIGTGLDNIDLDICQKLGITVLNTPDAATETVAEYTLGLIIALCRGLVSSHEALRAGQWQRCFGRELQDTRLGLLGFGRIGQAVARRAKAFGMLTSAHDPDLPAHVFAAAGVRPVNFDELLRSSDVLSLHLPLHAQTRHIIGQRALAQLPWGSYLINTSRGGLLDESALCQALSNGQLAGAALDVFEQEPYTGPLRKFPNLILSPHQAANSEAARHRMERQASENLIRYFS